MGKIVIVLSRSLHFHHHALHQPHLQLHLSTSSLPSVRPPAQILQTYQMTWSQSTSRLAVLHFTRVELERHHISAFQKTSPVYSVNASPQFFSKSMEGVCP